MPSQLPLHVSRRILTVKFHQVRLFTIQYIISNLRPPEILFDLCTFRSLFFYFICSSIFLVCIWVQYMHYSASWGKRECWMPGTELFGLYVMFGLFGSYVMLLFICIYLHVSLGLTTSEWLKDWFFFSCESLITCNSLSNVRVVQFPLVPWACQLVLSLLKSY